MPVANAQSPAWSRTSSPRMRPSGRPRKIVPPAIAPSRRIWAELKSTRSYADCKGRLTWLRGDYSCAATRLSNRGWDMAHRHTTDEYLETIYFLAFPIGEYSPNTTRSPTLAARVAEMLGVSRASAGEMLKRLEAEGLVERGEHKEAILTESGRARAERAVRKHRLIERFLTDFLGYTAAEAHEYADELGETFTDDMVERMAGQLGNPTRCPHGWPVDTDVEQAENRELAPLSELAPGTRATIVRLAEHDGELLHWFYDQGLVPDTELELQAAEPAAGQFAIRVEGDEKAIGEKAAAGLFVRPAA